MNTQTSRLAPFFLQLSSALWLGLAGALTLVIALNLGVSVFFAGRILPGVTMNGIPLSGEDIQQAAGTITSAYNFPDTGSILLVDGERSWLATPAQLGVYLDPQASAQAAYNAGRRGSLTRILADRLQLFRDGLETTPVFLFDQRKALEYLTTLSYQINQPLREASLSISGTDVLVNNGQPGRALDIQATLAAVSTQIQLMRDGVVPLVILETSPAILDASLQGDLARGILSQPFQLTIPSSLGAPGGPWQIDPPTLAQLLTFEKVDGSNGSEYRIIFNKVLMTAFLESIQSETDKEPENARFIFNDDTTQLDLMTPAVIGRKLNLQGSLDKINETAQNGLHSAELVFDLANPAVTDQMTGADLGITELVTVYTSYFRGSTADRIQNIKTASARFHGLLIPPGGTLSMSDELGNISLDNGYAEALIILGDQTIKGVGGGVCQVSTTLFRTVFYGGFPVVERHAHAYRVGYYEQTVSGHNQSLAGLDATVFVPLVDFKFTNDTPYWLLMETYVSTANYSLTWKFYSTSDGRTVDYTSSGPTNIVPAPDAVYRENPELPSGTKKQVDWAADGADVVVTRTVTRAGETLFFDRFNTHYQPWRDVWEYGPGTEGIPTPTPNP